MKKPLIILAFIVFAMSAWVGNSALASSYEWLSNLQISPSNVVRPGYQLKIYRDITTSGSYQEYRSVYYQYTTSTSAPLNDFWNEWTECRVSGAVNVTLNDRCFPTVVAWAGNTTSTLWIRATTNYQNCGEYTSNPDRQNCGDTITTSVPYLPNR